MCPGVVPAKACPERRRRAGTQLGTGYFFVFQKVACPLSGTPRRWFANKTEENLRQWIASQSNFTVVAVHGERICGFGMHHDSGEVLLYYVTSEAGFLGASTLIPQANEQQARRWGLQKLFLTSTITARSFYEPRGWIVSGDPIAVFGMEWIFPITKALAN
jgi:hypothetical protein